MSETFMGLRVHQSPLIRPVPNLQISPNFKYCSEQFRRNWNAWALERFGTHEVAYMFDMSAIGMRGGALFVNPKHFAMLRNCT